MKKTHRFYTSLAVAVMIAAGAQAQEYLRETFDGALLGPINSLNGWGGTNYWIIFTNTQPALVNNANPCAGAHSLAFPMPIPAGKQCVFARYTNLNATYSYTGTNHPVMRTGFMLYKQAAAQDFGFLISINHEYLYVGTDTNDGTIVVDEYDTGVPYLTNRYAEMALLYNMSNNDLCVQYNGSNIVTWSGMDAPSLTQLTDVVFWRVPDAYAGTNLFVDEILADKPTPDTLAWWRYETPDLGVASDHAGFFRAARVDSPASLFTMGAARPLYDGWQDRADERGRRKFQLQELRPWTNSPKLSDWTIEGLVAMSPAAVGASEPNLQFLDWGNGFGYNTTNAWISMTWVESSQQIAMCLRDGQRTTTGYDYLAPLGEVPADGRWHHVAAVKTNSWLTVYVDYRRTANVPLSGAASGVYQFAAASLAYVGRTLGSGNITTTNQWLDELRISSRGLRSREFLQFGQPTLLSLPDFRAGTWTFEVQTIPGKFYQAQTASGPGASVWNNHPPATIATGHYDQVTLPAQTGRVLRVFRQ